MKKPILLLLLCLSAVIAAKDWELTCRNITLKKKHGPMQELAKEELERHLELIAGKATATDNGLQFFIGIQPDNAPSAGKHESICVIDHGKIYFYGDEGSVSRPHYGALFAVYNFLEKQCGIHWIYTGDMGIDAPKTQTHALPDTWECRFTPPWELTSLRYGSPLSDTGNNIAAPDELKISDETSIQWHAERHLWELRMRLCTRHTFKYGHAFTKWWSKYGKDHPEYFGLNPYGKRGLEPALASRCKLCLSNPAVVDQIIADWEAAGKPPYLNICPNDGTPGYCFCENCRKLDCPLPGEGFYAHKTDRYVNFWNRIAEKAVQKRPDITLIAYIYSYYRFPPRREHIAYPDNMTFGIVPAFKDDYMALLEGWRKAGVKRFFIRPNYQCYSGVLPRGLERWLYDNFQNSRSFGIMGADYDGSPQPRALNLEYYVIARMLAFPDMKLDDILNEYYNAYGPAAPFVKTYYERQRIRGEKCFNDTRKHIQDNKIDMLDDGGFGHYAIHDHTCQDFVEDLAVLRKADTLAFTSAQRKRFDNLLIQTEHFILTARFYEDARAGKDREASGQALIDFRIKHKDDIKCSFGAFFKRFEARFWKDVKAYNAYFKETTSKPVIPENGFRSSFDLPSMDGWEPREAFDKITSETASFDKYSIQMKTTKLQSPALKRKRIPVTPGATYQLAADWKIPTAASRGALILVDTQEKQLLQQPVLPADTFIWKTTQTSFTIPQDAHAITITILTQPTDTPQTLYVDYIRLTKATAK